MVCAVLSGKELLIKREGEKNNGGDDQHVTDHRECVRQNKHVVLESVLSWRPGLACHSEVSLSVRPRSHSLPGTTLRTSP